MARITVEDCLETENNRFSLVFLASKRAKQLVQGKPPVVDIRGNKAVVSALREIAEGKVRFAEVKKKEQKIRPSIVSSEVSFPKVIEESS